MAVYIPPQASTNQALKELYGNISEQETVHPDAAFVVTGDFNKDSIRTIASTILKKVEDQFNTNNARSMWQGINNITGFRGIKKLQTLGLNRSLCSWILDFLTGKSQVVRMGNNTSSPLTLNTRAPQGYILSPLLYSLYSLYSHTQLQRHRQIC